MNAPETALKLDDWQAQVARREFLTSEVTVREHLERSIAAIQHIARLGHTLRVSFSAGKDSTCLLAATIEALLRMKEAGETIPELHMCSADTMIELPEISALTKSAHQQAKDYCLFMGIVIHSEITTPRLSEQFWPRFLGGFKLPSFPDGRSECSVDMKIKPMARLAKKLDHELAAAGKPPSVTLLGTRFSESGKRAAAMLDRGESETEPRVSSVGSHDCLTLSPIASWQTETVWAFLQRAGRSKAFRAFADNFSATYEMYDAASGGECVIYDDPALQNRRSAGCSARTGCHQCQVVQDDTSLGHLVRHPDYQYLKPLYRLRTFIRNTRFDFTRRRWVGRQIEADTGALRIFPNCLSFKAASELFRIVLTIDKRELQRAKNHQAALDAGRIEDTPRNRRLAQCQYTNLDSKSIVAIDYLWSLNAMARPHEALRIYSEVMSGVGELDVPDVPEVPRTRVPEKRYKLGNMRWWHNAWGMRDVHLEAVLFDGEGITYKTDPKTGQAFDLPVFRDEDTWDIDEEAAAMFFDWEFEDRMRETERQTVAQSVSAAEYYLRMGIVSYPHRQRSNVDKMLRQSRYLVSMGLAGDVDVAQALDGSMNEQEYLNYRNTLNLDSRVGHVPPTSRPVPPAQFEMGF